MLIVKWNFSEFLDFIKIKFQKNKFYKNKFTIKIFGFPSGSKIFGSPRSAAAYGLHVSVFIDGTGSAKFLTLTLHKYFKKDFVFPHTLVPTKNIKKIPQNNK